MRSTTNWLRGVDKYVVIDVSGASYRLKQVGGLAALTSELPCNIAQLGWWEFDPVPAGAAQFHYPDFEQPVGFVVPEASVPQAPVVDTH